MQSPPASMTLFHVHTLYIQAVPTIRQPPVRTGQHFEQKVLKSGDLVALYLNPNVGSCYSQAFHSYMFAYQERLLHLINFHFVSCAQRNSIHESVYLSICATIFQQLVWFVFNSKSFETIFYYLLIHCALPSDFLCNFKISFGCPLYYGNTHKTAIKYRITLTIVNLFLLTY